MNAFGCPINVIGYCRLSLGSEESTSIKRQKEIIERYCAERGWHLVDIEIDPIASATKLRLNRPALNRVRERIKSGEASAVLIWRMDRIARNIVDFGTLVEEGLKIVSVSEGIDTTTDPGWFAGAIQQLFAQSEAKATAARVANSIDFLRRNRRFAGGRVPYGYRTAPNPDGPGRVLEIAPEAAAFVQEAVERVLAGETVYAVAQDFNARRVPTSLRGSAGWSGEALRSILVGDAVLGRVTHKGEVIRDEMGIPAEVWPPIITIEKSQRLRALLARRKPGGQRRKSSRLLSGLVVCGVCGRPLNVQRAHSGPDLYRCVARTRFDGCSRPVTIQCEPLEAEIERRFLYAVGGFPYKDTVVVALEPTEVAQVEEAINETAAALARPDADFPVLVERLTALRARREELKALPVVPEQTEVLTGLTYAQEWAARADDTMGRRRILAENMDGGLIVVGSGKGIRSWVPERIASPWDDPDAMQPGALVVPA